jgi:hypothetical protein
MGAQRAAPRGVASVPLSLKEDTDVSARTAGSHLRLPRLREPIGLPEHSGTDRVEWKHRPDDCIPEFCDPGVTFPADTVNNGIVDMYLPVSMLESVLTLLRIEKIVSVYFTLGRGFLYTGNRTIGGG